MISLNLFKFLFINIYQEFNLFRYDFCMPDNKRRKIECDKIEDSIAFDQNFKACGEKDIIDSVITIGKYGKAIIYTTRLEEKARVQIQDLMDNEISEDAKVRIMPDVHAGAGCVIGFTSTLTDKVVPNLIGVDIGCGVVSFKLGNLNQSFEDLYNIFKNVDDFIKQNIPHGFNIRKKAFDKVQFIYETLQNNYLNISYDQFIQEIQQVCQTQGQDFSKVMRSLGSLGGGNHFIEIDKDASTNVFYLIIHSGSRNFGLKIATYHQKIAESIAKNRFSSTKPTEQIIKRLKEQGRHKEIQEMFEDFKKGRFAPTGLEYLKGEDMNNYIHDMKIAQIYAQINRRIMSYQILDFLGYNYKNVEQVESVHNYIDFSDNVVRKGAISAHKNEMVLIPLNMAKGTILGLG